VAYFSLISPSKQGARFFFFFGRGGGRGGLLITDLLLKASQEG